MGGEEREEGKRIRGVNTFRKIVIARDVNIKAF